MVLGEHPAPPDPRAVIEDLRRRLRAEQEKSLNAADAVLGARAVAAQARAETQEIYYRLHVTETELNRLKELLAVESAERSDGSEGARSVEAEVETEEPRPPAVGEAVRILVGALTRRAGWR